MEELISKNNGMKYNVRFRWQVIQVIVKSLNDLPEAFEEAKTGFLEFKKVVTNSENMDINMSGHGFRWWFDTPHQKRFKHDGLEAAGGPASVESSRMGEGVPTL